MAITQISRIQHRRGLKLDLPANLNEGELGFCLDTRELFVGNGPTFAGNTQILTNHTDNVDIIEYYYKSNTPVQAITGSSASQPTIRTLQEKLDDIVSVKDYGAVGDGLVDDTASILRALADIYGTPTPGPYAASMGYRMLYFPAGTYLISSPLLFYPNSCLIGDGKGRTFIKMIDGSTTCVARSCDSLGQIDTAIGTNSAAFPVNINVVGMTFQGLNVDTIVLLQRINTVAFVDVSIAGNYTYGSGNASAQKGLVVENLGFGYTSRNIAFERVFFLDLVYGIYVDDVVVNSSFTHCAFLSNYNGANIGLAGNGPQSFRISNSNFRTIESTAFLVGSTSNGVASTNNRYDTPVSDFGGGTHIISFGPNTYNCSSIGDSFYRSVVTPSTLRVNIGDPTQNVLLSGQDAAVVPHGIPSHTPDLFGPLTVLDAQFFPALLGLSYPVASYNTIFIKYGVNLNGIIRSGVFQITSDGTFLGTNLVDTFDEVGGATGITFGAFLIGANIEILYISGFSGFNANFTYIEEKWLTV